MNQQELNILWFRFKHWITSSWVWYQLRLLPHRPRLLINKYYIRKDEFHSSLDIDVEACLLMNRKDNEQYMKDLIRRRNIAHERDLKDN